MCFVWASGVSRHLHQNDLHDLSVKTAPFCMELTTTVCKRLQDRCTFICTTIAAAFQMLPGNVCHQQCGNLNDSLYQRSITEESDGGNSQYTEDPEV